MKGSDAQLFALCSHILSSKHGSIGAGFITVSLNLHTSGHTGNRLTAGQIGDVDKGVVEGGVDVSHTKDQLTWTDLGTESDIFFNFDLSCFLQIGWMDQMECESRLTGAILNQKRMTRVYHGKIMYYFFVNN